MIVLEQEILDIRKFIFQLNSIKDDSIVVVEGKRDSMALRRTGYSGKILEFHRFEGMIDFTDTVAKYERVIVLFDRDKTGRALTAKTIQLLQRRTKIDLSFKRKLREITNGKIKFIEQLVSYESFLEQD